MALKPITLRLDDEEYEKLKEHLSKFGDPDVNVGYVLRAYIRDLNRALPLMTTADWDLKNYFGLVGFWLRQIGTITDVELLTKIMGMPWFFGNVPGFSSSQSTASAGDRKGRRKPTRGKGGD